MEIYERIYHLRKKILKLTRAEFGEHLSVGQGTIVNIELNRLAKPEQKQSLYKLICKEFSVNEDWLLNGVEPVFIEPETFSLDDFCKEHGATELELKIVKAYFELPAEIRGQVFKHFYDKFKPEQRKDEPTTEEAEEIYRKSLSSVRKTESSTSSITADTPSTKIG